MMNIHHFRYDEPHSSFARRYSAKINDNKHHQTVFIYWRKCHFNHYLFIKPTHGVKKNFEHINLPSFSTASTQILGYMFFEYVATITNSAVLTNIKPRPSYKEMTL